MGGGHVAATSDYALAGRLARRQRRAIVERLRIGTAAAAGNFESFLLRGVIFVSRESERAGHSSLRELPPAPLPPPLPTATVAARRPPSEPNEPR